MKHKVPRRRRCLPTPPASGRKPELNLAPRDVEAMADELAAYHQLFHSQFRRSEQREWSEFYLRAQLSEIERKNIEAMVLRLIGPSPNAVRAVQQFIGEGRWDDQAILSELQRQVAQTLGEADAVVIVDGSGFPKQGQHSVGVAPQYCGLLGKIANCQEGVFLVYASQRGYTFLDCRLYLPRRWFQADHRKRWEACDIPNEVRFKTEPALALEMLQALARAAVLPFRWVTADEHFGEIPAFLDGIEALHKYYMAEVPINTHVWLSTPAVQQPGQSSSGRPRTRLRVWPQAAKAQALCDIAAQLPKAVWRTYIVKEGSKGPLVAAFAFLRVTRVRKGLPGSRVWAIFRRSLGPKPELKTFLSNAPTTCAQVQLVRLTGLRWPVETAIEEGKGEVGMDHYETRTWRGWHHQMTHSFLAHFFLVRMRVKLKKSAGHDHGASPHSGRLCSRAHRQNHQRNDCHGAIPSATKLRGLSLAPQKYAQTSSTIPISCS